MSLRKIIGIVLLAWLACAPVQAAEVPVTSCVARLAAGQDVAALMARPAAFTCTEGHVAGGPGDFLVDLRFAPIRSPIGEPLVLRTTSLWQDSARYHFRYADGSEQVLDFSSRDAARYTTIGAIWEMRVPPHTAPLDRIFVEIRGAANLRGVMMGTQLASLDASYARKLTLAAMYAAFAGLALALVVYNLSLWAALGHRFQLLYCSMVGSLMAYTFTSSGALMFAMPWMANNDRLRINYMLLALCGFTALKFIRNFFEPEVCGPFLQRIIRGTSAAAMIAAIMYAVTAPWHIQLFDQIYFIAMTAMLSVVVPILINAWRMRSRYLWLFLLAWSAPIVTSALRAAHGFDLIGHSFLLDNGNLLALAIEALLSSVMITARLREISHERDHAVAGEQVARRLANTDPLTGLLNRRAFLDLAIGRRGRQRLLLIDIDHFKAVNDRLGHDAGDDVLAAIANAIQGCRPARSLAVRLGGEEFAVLLQRSAFDECPPSRVLDAVRNQEMPCGTKVTVSIGFADGMLSSEEDWKRLYRLADAALYRAKADGRDRACRATDFRAAA